MPPGIVVVDDGADQLAKETVRALRDRGRPARSVRAGDLARAPLRMTTSRAMLGDESIAAVLFRADWRSWFAEGFVDDDAEFCSSETAAAWLALLDLESILAINGSDAELWFSSAEWPVWRRRLEQAGIPVSALEVGGAGRPGEDNWQLWAGGRATLPGLRAARCFAAATPLEPLGSTSVWLGGLQLDGERSPVAEAAARVLEAHGARLAAIELTAADTVLGCTCRPRLSGRRAVAAAAAIAEEFDDHLRGR